MIFIWKITVGSYYLMNCRFDGRSIKYSLYLHAVEIGQPYTLGEAKCNTFLHGFPSIDVINITRNRSSGFISWLQLFTFLYIMQQTFNPI